MNISKTKKDAYINILNQLDDLFSSNGCNDFKDANNPELFLWIEELGADNLRLTLEEFRASSEYNDYRPNVSKDGAFIYTQDFVILAALKKELGLNAET